MSRITHNFREEFGAHQKCKRGKVYPYFVKYSPLNVDDVDEVDDVADVANIDNVDNIDDDVR